MHYIGHNFTLHSVWQPDSKSAPPPAIDTLPSDIGALGDAARARNFDAIELLINLAAASTGANAHDRATATQAREALESLTTDISVPVDIKDEIARQCAVLFELLRQAPLSRLNLNEAHEAVAQMPASLLCLAADAAEGATRANIVEEVALQIDPDNAGAAQMRLGANPVDVTRFVSQEELLVASESVGAAGATRLQLAVQGNKLVANGGQREELMARLDRGATTSVFVNLNGAHWVTVVLQPRTAAADALVDCLLFDTLLTRKHQAAVRSALENLLGDRLAEFVVAGGELQDHVGNACGALAVMFVRDLDASLKSDASTPKFEQIKASAEATERAWRGLNEHEQRAVAVGLRAGLLGGLTGRAD